MTLRNRFGMLLICAGLAGLPMAGLAMSASDAVKAAVNDPARPEADRARDADRKPFDAIELTGIHTGAKIAEIMPGGGYFTRIFSKLVGKDGVVYAWVPLPPPNAPAGGRDMAAPMRALAAEPGYANIKVAGFDPATPLPEKVDLVWTSLNYHDLHNRPNADIASINRMALNALKPGGLYVVIDHAASKGAAAADMARLHRVDPDLVKQEVTSVGFKFVMASDLLQHKDDDHTRTAHEVPRGKTDQFYFLFQKPAE